MSTGKSPRARVLPRVATAALSRMWVVLLLMGLYAVSVVVLHVGILRDKMEIPSTFHAVLGVVLGLLLVFRTNTAYDRWWEGRKLWGQLLNDSRNLCIKVNAIAGVDRGEGRHIGRLLVNFARALKEHLRGGIRARQLSIYQGMSTATADPKHVPMHIAGQIRATIVRWRREGHIDGFTETILDIHSRALMDICGGCERIRRTPLPSSYRVFLRRIILVYVVTLPWGLVDQLRYWTVAAVVIMAYFMIGIELIAEAVEEPFGMDEEDLALDDICRTFELSMDAIFQPENSPPAATEHASVDLLGNPASS